MHKQIEIIDSPDKEQWAELIADNPMPETLQLREFGEIKSRSGWSTKYVVFNLSSGVRLATMYLTRKIPMLGQFWYCPNAPAAQSLADFLEVCKLQKELSNDFNIFAIKMEPSLQKQSIAKEHLQKIGEIKKELNLRSCPEIQRNQNTIVIDLNESEDEVLAGFRQRARRYVRKADKLGVSVEAVEPSDDNLNIMFELYGQTAERGGFPLRLKDYHFNFWQTYAASGRGQLFFAKNKEGQIVAGLFALFVGSVALYKDGASMREGLPEGTSYLLQWEVMKWLKEKGVMYYDLHGSPPQDRLEDKTHRSYSLGVFKSSFNNVVTEKIGAHEQVFNDFKFKLWQKLFLRIAQSWSVRRSKDKGFY